MDVLSLLIKRTDYAIGTSVQDEWIKEVSNSDKDEVAIILTENSLNRYHHKGEFIIKLLETYSLQAMFDLKNPYTNTNVNFFLYVFTKRKNRTIMYGIYKEHLKNKHSRAEGLILAEEFPEKYFTYLDEIEKYLSTGMCPDDTNDYEFGSFDSAIRNEKCWNPNRYNKTVAKVREALDKEKTVLLKDVATIIRPRPDNDRQKTPYCCLPLSWTYPFDERKLREGVVTDCVIQKGDILLLNSQKMFLMYDSFDKEIHTSPNCFVIRPNTSVISSEYLYMYLKSDTAQIIMQSESLGTYVRQLRKIDLDNLKIAIPERDNQYYKKIFYAENFPIKDIEEINRILYDTSASEKENAIEDILDFELVNNLRTYKEEVKEKIIEQDLNEINTCFRHKAYKATLILVGSVLEAVLIDWLSELHGKNYFEEEYIDHNGKVGTLAIYIRDIKYLKRPEWIDEAEKAFAIKDKRNMVHAKLCLNSEEKINEDLCREVIGYLKDVLKTRNSKSILRKVRK